MTELRRMTCIICPTGCSMEIQLENGKAKSVQGYSCKRGLEYAETECNNPMRMLTTTAKVEGGSFSIVSVRTDKPVPKSMIFECMGVINRVQLKAPVHFEDIIVKNILGLDVNIVATKNVHEE